MTHTELVTAQPLALAVGSPHKSGPTTQRLTAAPKTPTTPAPTSADLDAFECRQVISRDTYKDLFARGPSIFDRALRYQSDTCCSRHRSEDSSDPRIEEVCTKPAPKLVMYLSSSHQMTAYCHLLKECEITAISSYQTLFARKLERAKEDVRERREACREKRKGVERAQCALRCYLSLEDKARKGGDYVERYGGRIYVERWELEKQEEKMKGASRKMSRSRVVERGWLGLIEECDKCSEDRRVSNLFVAMESCQVVAMALPESTPYVRDERHAMGSKLRNHVATS